VVAGFHYQVALQWFGQDPTGDECQDHVFGYADRVSQSVRPLAHFASRQIVEWEWDQNNLEAHHEMGFPIGS
jgi:hypothetical protein